MCEEQLADSAFLILCCGGVIACLDHRENWKGRMDALLHFRDLVDV